MSSVTPYYTHLLNNVHALTPPAQKENRRGQSAVTVAPNWEVVLQSDLLNQYS